MTRRSSRRRGVHRALLAAVLLVLPVVAGCAPGASELRADQGSTPLRRKLADGEYVQYLPRQAPQGILVIAHGSTEGTEADEDLLRLAETYMQRWVKFADEHRLIAVVPVFGPDFGSSIKEPGVPLGGYRGLAGKRIGADEFVDRIIDEYRDQLAGPRRFYLYGHSAGGQFAGRYAVRHPDRLKAVVLSAPGRYAFPDASAPWPYGQKEVQVRTVAGETPRIIRPDPEGWRKAAALPITVVVGTADLEHQPRTAGHVGTTRVDFAGRWVEAMTQLAPAGRSRVRLLTVPGVGHSSARLTPACQRALAEQIGEN